MRNDRLLTTVNGIRSSGQKGRMAINILGFPSFRGKRSSGDMCPKTKN